MNVSTACKPCSDCYENRCPWFLWKGGLTLDTIQALDVVLTNGTIVTASNSNYPDLFWVWHLLRSIVSLHSYDLFQAFRGGSTSFGIVSAIHATTFATPTSTTIFQYNWDLSVSSTASTISALESFVVSPSFPQEFGAELVLGVGAYINSSGLWLFSFSFPFGCLTQCLLFNFICWCLVVCHRSQAKDLLYLIVCLLCLSLSHADSCQVLTCSINAGVARGVH